MRATTAGYSPVPSYDSASAEAGPSRTQSASSSLASSPLQHAASQFKDEPYALELGEKNSAADSPFHHAHQPSPRRNGGRWAGVLDLIHRTKTAILLSVCVLLALTLLFRNPSSSKPSTASSQTKAAHVHRPEDDMVLITKVGSATVHSRLLTHLLEQSLSGLYIPNHLYSSDYALSLPSHNITMFDALANVSSTIAALEEFSTLRAELTALVTSNQDIGSMSDKDGGWKLDKYKFLPTFAEAWRRWPRKKWYVMVEADTFVFYNQLVQWLSTLNPDKQLMLGHPSYCDYDGNSTAFTHGGSGIVLSRAIMQASFGADDDFEHHQDGLIQKSAFGDALLSKSLYDAPGVQLKELSPEAGARFNSDPPRTLKFDRGNWCEPILSFHHVTPADTAHLYDFQRRIEPRLARGDSVRWADIWDEFQPGFLHDAMEQVGASSTTASVRAEAEPGEVGVTGWQAIEDWDSETTDLITDSASECLTQCRLHSDCLLWQWRKGEGDRPASKREYIWTADRRSPLWQRAEWGKCRFTSDFLRMGLAKPKQNDLVTGWMGSRIDRWRRHHDCSGRTGLNTY